MLLFFIAAVAFIVAFAAASVPQASPLGQSDAVAFVGIAGLIVAIIAAAAGAALVVV